MGRAGSPTIGQTGPGTRWRIEDSSRAGPSRRISEANGANDRDTVEEVAPRLPASDQLDGLNARTRHIYPANRVQSHVGGFSQIVQQSL